MKKTVIIGGGPSGAACALWLHQLGCKALLIEASSRAGGLQKESPYINDWFPAVMGLQGRQIAHNLHEQLLAAGVALRTNTPVLRVHVQEDLVDVHLSDGTQVQAHYLVVATGAKFRSGGFTASPLLSIGPGHNFEGMEVANRRVAILGGGDNSFDAYKFAMQRGAASAHIFARNLRAKKVTTRHVPDSSISVGAFEVDENAMSINGQPFDCISVQFGFEAVLPNGLEQLELAATGQVVSDHWGQTNLTNVYAIGEVANAFHPATVTSMAHGIQAAKHIQTRIESSAGHS